ncbi:hypothetical protein AJ80_03292 [Polytolypa hystricis UAMH7299]|uniref:NmrA-like domain-containing protein n=1 Tax=Polytolypa hystricis (strain UAMH7299) TaxID=1447883 RepID=A0A2B7YJA1_POLH7|nr:hypothetical protein AJ80_03292 [Polytolypa hystricis UAMH7299]
MASSPKLVTVFGATGNQGGSVAQSLLRNKSTFRVRAITRNPESEKALALAAAGAEVVKADGFKKDELVKAFEGSWAVFVNTNTDDPIFDEPNGPTEVDLGRIIVDAANTVGVEQFVYSSAGSVSEITKGEMKLDMMDHKYAIEQLARSSPNIKTVTAVYAAWYFENFAVPFLSELWGGFPFQADSEEYLTLCLPRPGGEDKVPYIAIEEDFGDLVHGVLLNPEKYGGKEIQATSQLLTYPEIIEAFQKVTGKKARYVLLSDWKDFPTMGVRSLENIKLMLGFMQWCEGRYYRNLEFDEQTAKDLKKSVEDSVGSSGSLVTADQFFAKIFGAGNN